MKYIILLLAVSGSLLAGCETDEGHHGGYGGYEHGGGYGYGQPYGGYHNDWDHRGYGDEHYYEGYNHR